MYFLLVYKKTKPIYTIQQKTTMPRRASQSSNPNYADHLFRENNTDTLVFWML